MMRSGHRRRPMGRRIDLLDGWRSLAVVLMMVYHFLFDAYIFGVLSDELLFSLPLALLQKFICCSFIFLAGVSARFSRDNLRHGVTVLAAGLVVEAGAALAGQTIRWGVLMLLGTSMILYHLLGRYLQRLPGWALALGAAVLYVLTDLWTGSVRVSVKFLYPLGFPYPGFHSADYFPLLPWSFLFLLGTAAGGWALGRREKLSALRLPSALTWPGRHSLLLYLLHQPVLYSTAWLLWGR